MKEWLRTIVIGTQFDISCISINCDLKKLWSQGIIVGNFFYILRSRLCILPALYLALISGVHYRCWCGNSIHCTPPPLLFLCTVYTYFKSQIEWIYSTLQISTVTKSITGSYMCCMTSNELPEKARGHKITQLINLYQVKATSPTPKYLYWCSHVICKPISC